MTLVDYLDTVTGAETVEDVWRVLCSAMEGYGFDRLIYGFTRARTPNSFGGSDDTMVLSNHDPGYLRHFLQDGMGRNGPMLRWAAHNTGSCSWSWIHERYDTLSEAERRVLALNRSYGVLAGYTISFHDVSVRSKGAIGLAARVELDQSDVDALWARDGRQIETMSRVAHLKITNLPHLANRRLTPRQREALEWVGDGKTTRDIATIMGLTPATVEKHLRLARKTLDVETTAQAVLKAAVRNHIFLADG